MSKRARGFFECTTESLNAKTGHDSFIRTPNYAILVSTESS